MRKAAIQLKALDETSPDPSAPPRWLLLFHQLPPKPAYARVKIWRRLQAIGAVAVKHSVYALPRGEQGFEDFQWLLRELTSLGGEGSVCEARFVDGLEDAEIEALFNTARDADYAALAKDARTLEKALGAKALAGKQLAALEAQARRLARRLDEIVAIDFCNAPGRQPAAGLVGDVTRTLAARSGSPASATTGASLRGRT